jgi:hypothetical protein
MSGSVQRDAVSWILSACNRKNETILSMNVPVVAVLITGKRKTEPLETTLMGPIPENHGSMAEQFHPPFRAQSTFAPSMAVESLQGLPPLKSRYLCTFVQFGETKDRARTSSLKPNFR